MDPQEALDEFTRMSASADDIDMARAALLIAAAEYPQLEVEAELSSLDSMAAVATSRIGDDRDALHCLNALSGYIFDELGFRGNREEYYDPRNSFLNDVLSRRLGIPITLSLVYMEVGKRLGVPLLGIGMPGHFLVRHRDVDDWFVDAFNGGILLSIEECAQRFGEVANSPVDWDPQYLAPVSNRDLIARMIRNLIAAYAVRGDHGRSLTMFDWALALQPGSAPELRDRGLTALRLGHHDEALSDLRTYLASGGSAPDMPQIQELVERIMRHLRN